MERNETLFARKLNQSFLVHPVFKSENVKTTRSYFSLLLEDGEFFVIGDETKKPFSSKSAFWHSTVVGNITIDDGVVTVDYGGCFAYFRLAGKMKLYCDKPNLSLATADGSDGINAIEVGRKEYIIDFSETSDPKAWEIYRALSGELPANKLGIPVTLSYIPESEIPLWSRAKNRMSSILQSWNFVTAIEIPAWGREEEKVIILEYAKKGKALRIAITGKRFVLCIAEMVVVLDDRDDGAQQLEAELQVIKKEITDIGRTITLRV